MLLELDHSNNVHRAFGYAADGLREEYSFLQEDPATTYAYDFEGNVSCRQQAYDPNLDSSVNQVWHDVSDYDAQGDSVYRAFSDASYGESGDLWDAVGYKGQSGGFTTPDLNGIGSGGFLPGAVLMGHRFYDPSTGRFVNRDPMGYGGRLNVYEYAGGNPVTGSDPSGYSPLSNAGQFLLGATDAVNPVKIWNSITKLPALASGLASGKISPAALGSGLVQGLEFWSAPNARVAGDRFTGDALLFAAGLGAISKIRALARAGKIVDAVESSAAGADNIVNGIRLSKQLHSEAQMSGVGKSMAGAGSVPYKAIRDIGRLVETYGGDTSDWAKMTSYPFKAADQTFFETHWYENVNAGLQVEFKTKFLNGIGEE